MVLSLDTNVLVDHALIRAYDKQGLKQIDKIKPITVLDFVTKIL